MPRSQGMNDGKDTKVITRRQALEIVYRIGLIALFIISESASPFVREIRSQEVWHYQYPIPKTSFLNAFGGPVLSALLSPNAMILYAIGIILFVRTMTNQPSSELVEALLVPTLALPMTGIFVNVIKIGVGRPRPTYMARCYGPYYFNRYEDASRPCTGNKWFVADGRKSFPSGHASLAFACFTFIFLYTSGQLGTFHERGRRRYSAHLMLIPYLLSPIIVSVSRISDYKHHWEDVVTGGIFGVLMSYLAYRIYFPSIFNDQSHLSYTMIQSSTELRQRLPSSLLAD